MKKLFCLFSMITALAFITFSCQKSPVKEVTEQGNGTLKSGGCTTIQSGMIKNSQGATIVPGYDEWGYNYQAHMFNGGYCDAYYNAGWCQPYVADELIMKWNDAWMSNQDCNGDGLLDRHNGYPSYIGSGAWLTNHQQGTYVAENGQVCHWTYFCKIIAAPADATLTDGTWYNAGGTEIGPMIWNEFAIIQEVTNDPCAGIHGLQYASPDHAGLGGW